MVSRMALDRPGNVATHIEQLDEGEGGPPLIQPYGGVSLHEQSHGTSFLALVLNRFGGAGCGKPASSLR